MKGLRALAALALVLGLVWLLAGRGWGTPPALQLIQIRDLSPRDAELGDRIAILGEGFPAGKPARVTFRGTLHRPGVAEQRGAQVSIWGTVLAPDRIEAVFDDASESLFCGSGDRSIHTTFEGDVEVAFAAAQAGEPPIGGVLAGITFDVRPGPNADAAMRDHEGERLLAFLGVHVASGPRAAGLRVEAVDTGSRAQAAGLAPGDVLEAFNGVRIASSADLVPEPGERDASLTLRRAAYGHPIQRTVGVAGFRADPPPGLRIAALLVLGALAVVLLYAAPTPPGISAWLQRGISRLRAKAPLRGARRSLAAALAQSATDVASDLLPDTRAPAIVDLAACALIALLAFGQSVVATTLDAGILFVACATALVTATLASRGSIGARLRHALHVAWQHAPAAVAVACVVFATGSVRIQEIARAQGSLPWDWLAFRSPALLVALAMLLSCARIDLAALEDGTSPPSPGRGRNLDEPSSAWLRAAFRGHRIVIAGLASVLFLGGWSLPGWSLAQQDARRSLEIAGAAWLMMKTGAVVWAMAWTRWAVAPTPLPERSKRTAQWLIPVGAVTFGITAVWDVRGLAPGAQGLVSGALLVLAVLGAGALAHRLAHGLLAERPTGETARLSPFI